MDNMSASRRAAQGSYCSPLGAANEVSVGVDLFAQEYFDDLLVLLHLSIEPSASTWPSCSTVTRSAMRRQSPCRARRRPACSRPRASGTARRCASSRRPSCRRPARRAAGAAAPASAACRFPAIASGRATAVRRGAASSSSLIVSRIGMMRPCAVESSFAVSVGPHALVGLAREFEVLEHRVIGEHGRLLELAADAAIGDFRLGQAREVDRLAEERGADPVGFFQSRRPSSSSCRRRWGR